MTIPQIAHRLAELCNQGKFEEAQKELYADDAVSIESDPGPNFEQETKGLGAIIDKGKKFNEMIEESHGCGTSDPVVGGNSFAIALNMDVTMKGQPRSTFSEICVYKVKDGKIISEHFFS